LSPLSKTQIQRVHIGGTDIEDLTPLANLPLTRLIFNPAKVTKGLEAIKKIPTLQELGTTLEGRMWPADFWAQLEQGPQNKPAE